MTNGFRLRLLKMSHKPDGDWYPGWQVNRKNMIVFGLQKCHETHLRCTSELIVVEDCTHSFGN